MGPIGSSAKHFIAYIFVFKTSHPRPGLLCIGGGEPRLHKLRTEQNVSRVAREVVWVRGGRVHVGNGTVYVRNGLLYLDVEAARDSRGATAVNGRSAAVRNGTV